MLPTWVNLISARWKFWIWRAQVKVKTKSRFGLCHLMDPRLGDTKPEFQFKIRTCRLINGWIPNKIKREKLILWTGCELARWMNLACDGGAVEEAEIAVSRDPWESSSVCESTVKVFFFLISDEQVIIFFKESPCTCLLVLVSFLFITILFFFFFEACGSWLWSVVCQRKGRIFSGNYFSFLLKYDGELLNFLKMNFKFKFSDVANCQAFQCKKSYHFIFLFSFSEHLYDSN